MAIHPDDPPYSIFGLPRVVKNRDDLDWICRAVDSPPTALRSAPARLPKILIMTCTPSWPNLPGVSEFILPTSAI